VHSENEVVYLLSAWVKAQETAGCPAAEQLEQLVVRCAWSMQPRLPVMMPALAGWFKEQPQALGMFARPTKNTKVYTGRMHGLPSLREAGHVRGGR
jgi:hypothetical protein